MCRGVRSSPWAAPPGPPRTRTDHPVSRSLSVRRRLVIIEWLNCRWSGRPGEYKSPSDGFGFNLSSYVDSAEVPQWFEDFGWVTRCERPTTERSWRITPNDDTLCVVLVCREDVARRTVPRPARRAHFCRHRDTSGRRLPPNLCPVAGPRDDQSCRKPHARNRRPSRTGLTSGRHSKPLPPGHRAGRAMRRVAAGVESPQGHFTRNV